MLTKQSAPRSLMKRYSDYVKPKSGSIGDVPSKSLTAGKLLDVSLPLKRARSCQNISQLTSSACVDIRSATSVLRRTSSFQNIDTCSDAFRSSPVSISMACNAELLASFERERRHFEDRISELLQVAESRRTEAERLKIELRDLRTVAAVSSANVDEVTLLRHENHMMRDRLAELNVTIEHFTDAEKLTLLQTRDSSDHDIASISSRDAYRGRTVSDVCDLVHENEADFSAGSLEANWDHASDGALTIGSGSEVSLACLQDRLLAMEETQYSTNEELAATLQELGDLQNAINTLTAENERLADERTILLESLCTQTQKLENARRQIQHLKNLLFRDGGTEEHSENERQLMALVRSAEEEREELLLKQAELCNTLELAESEKQELFSMSLSLREQLADALSEKHFLEWQSTSQNENSLQSSSDQLTDEIYPSDGTNNLEQGRCSHCHQLECLLTNSRLELAAAASDCIQLRYQLDDTESRMKELQQSALCQSAEMDRRLRDAEHECEEARNAITVLHASNSRVTEEQRAAIERLESDLQLARIRVADAERVSSEISIQFDMERKEWESFQRDLQTAVVVAVDIRSEAQEQIERLQMENQSLLELEHTLQHELEVTQTKLSQLRRIQQIQEHESSAASNGGFMRDRFMSSVDRELSLLHQSGRRASDLCLSSSTSSANTPSLSVQRLISSIEEQIKSVDMQMTDSAGRDMQPGRAKNFGRSLRESVTSSIAKPVLTRYWSQPSGNRVPCCSAGGKRNTIEASTVGATDEVKCAVAEASVLPPVTGGNSAGNRKPLTGILTNKSGWQKTFHG